MPDLRTYLGRGFTCSSVALAFAISAGCRAEPKPRGAEPPIELTPARAKSAAVVPPSNGLGSVFPADTPRAPLATKLCAALHGVVSDRRAACCGGASTAPLLEPCERAVSAAIAARAVLIDDTAVDRCRSTVEARFKGCDWVTPALPTLPPECQGLVRGALADGSVCRSSLECTGQSHCAGLTPTKTGTCTPPRALGAACGTHVDALAAYLLERDLERTHPFCADFCALTTHRCAPRPSEGDACFSAVNCAPGQRCDDGRCGAGAAAERSRARAGESCSTDFDCAVGGCVPHDDGTKTCGMKCIASLEALMRSPSKAMKLPLR